MALALVKLSLLFQYLRIADERPDLKQIHLRRATLAMIGVVTIWGLIESFLAWIPSNPISADWDFTGMAATRWGYGSREVGALSVSIPSDLVMRDSRGGQSTLIFERVALT